MVSTCGARATGQCEVLDVAFNGTGNMVFATYTLNITDLQTSNFTEEEVFNEQVSRAEAGTFLDSSNVVRASSIVLGQCE